MSTNRTLPSGKVATRFWSGGQFYYQLPTVGTEEWVTLSRRDIGKLARFAGYRTVLRTRPRRG
jgi:hypothetical protein